METKEEAQASMVEETASTLEKGISSRMPSVSLPTEIKPTPSRVVKVTGLAADVSESQLRELFLHCGEIVSFEWRMDLNGSSFAMVEFVDSTSAESALLLDGTIVHGERIHVEGVEDSSTSFSGMRKSAVIMLNVLVEKGYEIGHDMMERAKAYDEKHHITERTKSAVAERSKTFVQKSKLAAASVSARCKETDEKYRISKNINEAAKKTGHAISSRYQKVKEDENVQRAVSSVKGAFQSSTNWFKDQVSRMKEGPKFQRSNPEPSSN